VLLRSEKQIEIHTDMVVMLLFFGGCAKQTNESLKKYRFIRDLEIKTCHIRRGQLPSCKITLAFVEVFCLGLGHCQ
jgi:hypothetical protein